MHLPHMDPGAALGFQVDAVQIRGYKGSQMDKNLWMERAQTLSAVKCSTLTLPYL